MTPAEEPRQPDAPDSSAELPEDPLQKPDVRAALDRVGARVGDEVRRLKEALDSTLLAYPRGLRSLVKAVRGMTHAEYILVMKVCKGIIPLEEAKNKKVKGVNAVLKRMEVLGTQMKERRKPCSKKPHPEMELLRLCRMERKDGFNILEEVPNTDHYFNASNIIDCTLEMAKDEDIPAYRFIIWPDRLQDGVTAVTVCGDNRNKPYYLRDGESIMMGRGDLEMNEVFGMPMKRGLTLKNDVAFVPSDAKLSQACIRVSRLQGGKITIEERGISHGKRIVANESGDQGCIARSFEHDPVKNVTVRSL